MSVEPGFFVAIGAVVAGGGFLTHVIMTTRSRKRARQWEDGTNFDDQLEAAREDVRAYRALCEDYWLRASQLVSMSRGAIVTKEIADAEDQAATNATKFKAWFQLAQAHESAFKRFAAYDKTDRVLQAGKSAELKKMVSQLEELMTAADLATPTVDMLEMQLPSLIAFELEVRRAS